MNQKQTFDVAIREIDVGSNREEIDHSAVDAISAVDAVIDYIKRINSINLNIVEVATDGYELKVHAIRLSETAWQLNIQAEAAKQLVSSFRFIP